jgi:hypothetical protein
VARFLAPLERYKRIVSMETEPSFVDDEIIVVGVNTARSLVFKGGRINREQVKRVARMFCGASSQQVRILVTHHPFDLLALIKHLLGVPRWQPGLLRSAPDAFSPATCMSLNPERRPNITSRRS